MERHLTHLTYLTHLTHPTGADAMSHPQMVDGEWMRHDRAVMVFPDPADEPALRQDVRFWVPAYLGPSGWLGLDLDGDTDWTEVAELIDASYRVTAPRRLVRQLDPPR